jgi:hypothetical protein
MVRMLLGAVVVFGLIAAVSAGPVKGPIVQVTKAQEAVISSSGEVVGDPIQYEAEFEAGKRAMACVQGDHLPVVPVTIQVFDSQKKLVAEHRPKADVAAVVWYPERRQKYTVVVQHLGTKDWNRLTVILR